MFGRTQSDSHQQQQQKQSANNPLHSANPAKAAAPSQGGGAATTSAAKHRYDAFISYTWDADSEQRDNKARVKSLHSQGQRPHEQCATKQCQEGV